MTQFKVLGNEKLPMVTESTTGWTGEEWGRGGELQRSRMFGGGSDGIAERF